MPDGMRLFPMDHRHRTYQINFDNIKTVEDVVAILKLFNIQWDDSYEFDNDIPDRLKREID